MRGDESRVVEAFCAYLEGQGWQVETEVEHVDVVAARGDERLLAELKGPTSDPGLDVDTAYGQLLRRMTGHPEDRYALVVPAGRAARAALRVSGEVRQLLRIEVLAVEEDGTVTSL